MEEIKIGEYCRTKDGFIAKIIEMDMEDDLIEFDGDIISRYGEESCYLYRKSLWEDETKEIIKHSFNLIDLIEVGDYVNKYRVESTNGNGIYDNLIGFGDGRLRNITAEEIKSIVTHEQFNSIKYEVI